MKQNKSAPAKRGSYRMITSLFILLLFSILFCFARFGGEAALLCALYGAVAVTGVSLLCSSIFSILEEKTAREAKEKLVSLRRRI